MPKRKIIYALLIFLLLTSVAFAQTQEIKKHKVIKGDTLWDIANAELQNPFSWPKIWKENNWIKNPHKIYPDQVIKIPAFFMEPKESKDEAMRQDAASYMESVKRNGAGKGEFIEKKQPLIDETTLMSSGYMVSEIPSGGKIGESPSEQCVYGEGDTFWAHFGHPVKAGDKFYVVKVSDMIRHPLSRAKMGYIISIGGIAEIVKTTGNQTMAKINECFREIDKGEFLVPYYKMKIPMTTEQFRRPDVNGLIIAARSDQPYQATLDVVYIDKGWKDGIEPGDLFRTIAAVNNGTSPNGVIQVISCGEHTATAIIKSSISIISAGNTFVAMK